MFFCQFCYFLLSWTDQNTWRSTDRKELFVINNTISLASEMKAGGSQPVCEWSEMIIMLEQEEGQWRVSWWSSQFHLPPTLWRRWRPSNDPSLSLHWQKVMNQTDPSWPATECHTGSHWDIKSVSQLVSSLLSDAPARNLSCCVPGVTSSNCQVKVCTRVLWLVSCPMISRIEKYQHKNWLSVRGAVECRLEVLIIPNYKESSLMIQNNGDFK